MREPPSIESAGPAAAIPARLTTPARLLARQAAAAAGMAAVLLERDGWLVLVAAEPEEGAACRPLALVGPADADLAPVRALNERRSIVAASAAHPWPLLHGPHLALPLLIGDALTGVLVISGATVATPALQAQLSDLAALGAYALREAAPVERRQATQLRAVAQAARTIVGSLELEQVLSVAVDEAVGVLGVDAASLWLLQPDGRELRRVATRNRFPASLTIDRMGLDAPSLTAEAGRTRRLQVVEQLSAIGDEFGLTRQALAGVAGVSSAVFVPLVARNALVGVLNVMTHQPRRFGEGDLQTVQTLANVVAVAIDNAGLFGAVEAQRRWLRTIISALPEGVVVAEAPGGRIIAANPAAERLLGRTLAEDALINDLAFSHPDGSPYPPLERPIVRTLRHGETCLGEELRYDPPEGPPRILLANTAPLRDIVGATHAGVAVFQDISELKAEQQRRDEFLSMVSHELKTPLTNVKGYAELLARRLQRESNAERHLASLGTIVQQVDRMVRLVNDLLELSRLETGQFEIKPAAVDLGQVVARAVEHARVAAIYHRVELDAPDRPVIVRADAGRLEQVLNNLLSNAAKYSPEGGRIGVALTVDGGESRVAVADEGPGIPPERRAQLFQRYYRLPGTVGTGLGLGLYISHQIISRHGGRLWVEGAAGAGSTFVLALPVQAGEERPVAIGDGPAGAVG